MGELGACPYNTRCRFAHGEEEIRQKPKPKQYKTKPCNNFIRTGKCPYGVRCNFLHGQPGSAEAALEIAQAQSAASTNNAMMQQSNPPNTNLSAVTAQVPQTYQQRMRSRQQQGWENFMSGVKHVQSGCYNVKTVRGFHCERPPISERFQAWKEMRGEGELPSHVLILQDNKGWIAENAQKQKSKQMMFQQQQQLQELSKLLLPNKESMNVIKSEENDDSESHSERNGKRRRHRKRSDDDEEEDDEESSSESSDGSRSRSRTSRSDNDDDDESMESNMNNDDDKMKENESEIEKSPSLDDTELSSQNVNNNTNDAMDEMPLPE